MAGFRDIDSVRLRRTLHQDGKVWREGTTGAIVILGPEHLGCGVEVGTGGDILDVAYRDLELVKRYT